MPSPLPRGSRQPVLTHRPAAPCHDTRPHSDPRYHETTGAVGRYAARHLRRLARDAAQHGGDGTDYRNTGTSSFIEHYSQRLSAANVMHGAVEGLKAINRAAKDRIARKRRSDVGV